MEAYWPPRRVMAAWFSGVRRRGDPSRSSTDISIFVRGARNRALFHPGDSAADGGGYWRINTDQVFTSVLLIMLAQVTHSHPS